MRLDPRFFDELRSPARSERRVVFGFDSEDDSKGRPLSFTFHDGKRAWMFDRPEDAVAFIRNHDAGAPISFFAHNLEYDLGNLLKCGDYSFLRKVVRSNIYLTVELTGTRNTLHNSAAFFPGTVAEMGEAIGLPKLAFDPRSPAYRVRDAQIVQVFMEGTDARTREEFGVPLGISIGQTSSSIFAKAYAPRGRRAWATYNDPKILNAFYGGRTEVFKVGTHEKPVTVADVNSAYPNAMASHAYPDCRQLEPSRLATHTHGVGRFTIRVPEMPFPPLPWRSHQGRIYFPTGDISGYWAYAEVRNAVRLGCKVLREEEGVGTNAEVYPFGNFVADLYRGKSNAKTRFEREFYKMLLNSAYGKFVQSHPDRQYTLEKPDGPCEMVGPFWEQERSMNRAPLNSNYLWGVHVTAYARIHLLDQILAAHNAGAEVLYCDTDSVMYTGAAPLDFGPGLGQMSIKSFDAAFFRLAKGYVLCRRAKDGDGYTVAAVAAKGVPSERGLDFLRYGVASAWKPVRLREGLVRSSGGATFAERVEGVNVWRAVKRSVRYEYVKRPRIGRSGTRPPRIREVELIEAHLFNPKAPKFSLDVRPSRRNREKVLSKARSLF